ncbi:MAG: site-specific integrase, partial [Chloroflexi bacterium]|nr:site-specific integrase [Chloroflexota bacterium]
MTSKVLTGEIVEEGEGFRASENGHALATENEVHPVYDYLLGLGVRSRPTQESALRSALSVLSSPWLRDRYGDAVGKSVKMSGRTRKEWEALREAVYEYPWNQIGRLELKAIIVAWRDFGLKGKTINRSLSAVRRVMWICTKAEYIGTRWEMSKDDYLEATDKTGLPKVSENDSGTAGRRLSDEEMFDLFDACDTRHDFGTDPKPEHPANAAREKAMLSLLFHRALRVREVCGLKITDYHQHSGKLDIRGGKSGDRSIHLSGVSKMYMEDWLRYRYEADPRTTRGPIFYRVDRGGKVIPYVRVYESDFCPGPFDDETNERAGCDFNFRSAEDRHVSDGHDRRPIRFCPKCKTERPFLRENRGITHQAIRHILDYRADLAGIEHVTTHDGRRTALSWLLEAGHAPAAQALAGHKDVAQTLRYQRYNPEQYAEATDALDRRQAESLGVELEVPEAQPEEELEP